MLVHLPARDVRGEFTRIDRRAQSVLIMGDGAHMVLVGMGDEDGFDLVAPFLQPSNIGQDQVHAGAAVHVREGNA